MANFISIFRTFLSFIVAGILFMDSNTAYLTAFILTIIIIWMDGLDGYLARKFNETSKLGALLDIICDRIVENVYWISFTVFGWLPLWVPLMVLTRGIVTDSLRSLALEHGYTAFGETTMMQSKIGKFIVASNFSRFSYAVFKAFAFALLIIAHLPSEYPYKQTISIAAYTCAYASVFFCVIRGIPVILESRRFFKESGKWIKKVSE